MAAISRSTQCGADGFRNTNHATDKMISSPPSMTNTGRRKAMKIIVHKRCRRLGQMPFAECRYSEWATEAR